MPGSRDYTRYKIKYGNETIASDKDKRGTIEELLNIIYDEKYHVGNNIRQDFYKHARDKHISWCLTDEEYNDRISKKPARAKRYFDKVYSWNDDKGEHSFHFWNNWGVGIFDEMIEYVTNIFGNNNSKITVEKIEREDNEPQLQNTNSNSNEESPRQIIYFGAPGTGKSYQLNEAAKSFEDRYERVTFYPGYSYQQFVGTYKPYMKDKDKDKEKEIEYKFVPGPLLRVLKEALLHKNENYLLIIEELNRAEAAAVFGDFFQLLDRNGDGESEYEIAVSEDMKKYLTENRIQTDRLSFPSNFYIWTTMNSADQGVFPLDTAFKRRWEFKYIGINEKEAQIGKNSLWNRYRTAINKAMLNAGINEDKLMGPFFLKENEQTGKKFDDSFRSKVLLYLFEDAMRLKRKQIFADKYCTSYSAICEGFNNNQEIFLNDDLNKLIQENNTAASEKAPNSDETKPSDSDKPDTQK